MSRTNEENPSGPWRHYQLVLFLGAGVSIPYGLPSWKSLVLELLFEPAQGTRRLGNMWPHYRRAVASWMTDYFEYDPLVLARMVERDLRLKNSEQTGSAADKPPDRFLDRLRAHMYANYREPKGRTTLQAISDLIAKSNKRSGVDSVITFNFDDLLERELRRRGVTVQSITSGDCQRSNGVRVVHAHGCVPKDGPRPAGLGPIQLWDELRLELESAAGFFPSGYFFVTPTQLRGRECVWQGVTGSPRRFYRDEEYQDDFFGSDSGCANYCCDCG